MSEAKESYGRRKEDKLMPFEKTWQEAARNNRKLIYEIGDGYKKFAKRVTWVLILLSAVIVISLLREQSLIHSNSLRVIDIQKFSEFEAQNVKEVKRLSAATANLVVDIQAQRIAGCKDTNARFKATVRRLDFAISHIEDPVQHRRAVANRKLTVNIISSLEPPRNCKDITKGGP